MSVLFRLIGISTGFFTGQVVFIRLVEVEAIVVLVAEDVVSVCKWRGFAKMIETLVGVVGLTDYQRSTRWDC